MEAPLLFNPPDIVALLHVELEAAGVLVAALAEGALERFPLSPIPGHNLQLGLL